MLSKVGLLLRCLRRKERITFDNLPLVIRIHEPILGEHGRTVGVLQDVERFFIVGITVAVVGTEPVAGKVPLGGFVQTGSQLVGLCVPGESVSVPASGVLPHSAAAGCIDVDADDEGVVGFVTVTDGHTVDAPAAYCR